VNCMQKQKALERLRKAKVEALANSTNIRVGRLELNEAIKALQVVINLEKILNEEKESRD